MTYQQERFQQDLERLLAKNQARTASTPSVPLTAVPGVTAPPVAGVQSFADVKLPTAQSGGGGGGIGDTAGKIGKGFLKLIDVVDTPRAAVVSTLKEIGDVTGFAGGDGSWDWDQWAQNTKDNYGAGELVEQVMGPDGTDRPMWMRQVAGFIGDVGLDPLTWLSGGTLAVAKGAGKVGAKLAAKEMGEASIDLALKNAGRKDIAGAIARTAAAKEIAGELTEAELKAATRLTEKAGTHGRAAFTQRNLKRSGVEPELLEKLNVTSKLGYAVGTRNHKLNIPMSRLLAEAIETGKGGVKSNVAKTGTARKWRNRFAPDDEAFNTTYKAAQTAVLEGAPNAAQAALHLSHITAAKVLAHSWGQEQSKILQSRFAWMRPGRKNVALPEGEAQKMIDLIETGESLLATPPPGVSDELFQHAKDVDQWFQDTADFLIANGVKINKRQKYIPHIASQEWQDAMDAAGEFDPNFQWIRGDRDAGFTLPRNLEAGRNWFGQILTEDDLTIKRLNEISLEKAGFKALEENPETIIAQYVSNATPQLLKDHIQHLNRGAGVLKPVGAKIDETQQAIQEGKNLVAAAKIRKDALDTVIAHTKVGRDKAAAVARSVDAEYNKVMGRIAKYEDRLKLAQAQHDSLVAARDALVGLNPTVAKARAAATAKIARVEAQIVESQKNVDFLAGKLQRARAKASKENWAEKKRVADDAHRVLEEDLAAATLTRQGLEDFLPEIGGAGTVGRVTNGVHDFNEMGGYGATFRDGPTQQAAIREFDALPDDALVAVYHGTDTFNGSNLLSDPQYKAGYEIGGNRQLSSRSKGIYVAATYDEAARYGNEVVRAVVRKGDLRVPGESSGTVGNAIMNSAGGAIVPPGVVMQDAAWGVATDWDAVPKMVPGARKPIPKDAKGNKVSSVKRAEAGIAAADAEIVKNMSAIDVATDGTNWLERDATSKAVALNDAAKRAKEIDELFQVAPRAVKTVDAAFSKGRGRGSKLTVAEKHARNDLLTDQIAAVQKALQDPDVGTDPVRKLLLDEEMKALVFDAKTAELMLTAQEVRDGMIVALNDPKFAGRLMADIEAGFRRIAGTTEQAPAWLADAMRKVPDLRNLSERQALTKALKEYDRAMNLWKSWATGSPGFVVRNLYSGMFSMYLDDVSPYNLRKMQGYLKHYEGWNNNWLSNTATDKQGFAFADAWARKKGYSEAEIEYFHKAIEAATGSGWGLTPQEVQTALQRGTSTGLGAKVNPFSTEFAPTGWVRNKSSNAEARMRAGHAFDHLVKGGDVVSATQVLERFHFNYRDISQLDRSLKRVMPFWMFYSRNMSLQASVWGRMPDKLNRSYYNFKRNMEQGYEGDEVKPRYFDDIGAVGTQFGKPGGSQWYATPDLPSLRFMQDIENLDDPVRMASSFAPPFKTAAQLFKGENLFTGAPFKDRLTDFDVNGNEYNRVAPRFFQLPGVKQATGYGSEVLGHLPGLEKLKSGIQFGPNGELLMTDRIQSVTEDFIPLLGRGTRLVPNNPRDESRVADRWLSFFGIPVKQNTAPMIQGENYRRMLDLQAEAKRIAEQARIRNG